MYITGIGVNLQKSLNSVSADDLAHRNHFILICHLFYNLEDSLLVVFCRNSIKNSTNRFCGASFLADNSSHVILGDGQTDDQSTLFCLLGCIYLSRVVDQCLCNAFNKSLHGGILCCSYRVTGGPEELDTLSGRCWCLVKKSGIFQKLTNRIGRLSALA